RPGRPPSPAISNAAPARARATPVKAARSLVDEEDLLRRIAVDGPPPPINTGDDATAVNDGWQPNATAPGLQDVDIRTADILGPYALLYPCRYVPEQGWINAILKTPLTVAPVEWREWVRKFPGYGLRR